MIATANLTEEIVGYWNGRATSYHNGVTGELKDNRRNAWERVLDAAVLPEITTAQLEGRSPRVIDLGCGPGFFCVIFAARGCTVDAIDTSESMLACARESLRAESLLDQVTLHRGDISTLPFPDNTFDIAIARNVTWLMRDPLATYREWLRVLAPGGKLLVFDANWYRYLVDADIDAARRADQDGNVLEGWDAESQATSEEERRCEEIAAKLPMTPILRPAWDVESLLQLGASSVRTDEDIWRLLWTESEQAYYSSSPMFLVEAVK